MTKRLTISVLLLIALGSQALGGQWLHVRVEEPGSDESVKINIPIALVHSLLPMIDDHGISGRVSHRGIRINGRRHLSVSELREIWDQVKNEPGYEFVSVDRRDEKVTVSMDEDSLLLKSIEGGDNEVDIRVPVVVVDALLSGQGDELDLMAAIEAFSSLGDTEVLSVRDGDSTVRIWIDGRNSQ